MDRLASLLTEINPDHCPRLARIGKVNCTGRSALNEERIFSAKEQQGPPLLLIMPYLQLLSYPATIFSEKYRRIGSIDQDI